MATSCPTEPTTTPSGCEDLCADIKFPEIPADLDVPKPPTVADVTTVDLDGSGAFDTYMRAGKAQLDSQWELGRIKGADYTNAYIAMQELMMTQANLFILKRFDSQMAAGLFKLQYIEQHYAAINAQLNTKKTLAEAHLVATQTAQLPLNGQADRALKCAQKAAQDKTVDLYDRQIEGFDDKKQADAFKTVMDAWAVQGVEIAADQTLSVTTKLQAADIGGNIAQIVTDCNL